MKTKSESFIRNLWEDFRIDLVEYLKIALIVMAMIALFVIAASACSPALEAWDNITGYGIGG